jgi:protein-disulfide isomerase
VTLPNAAASGADLIMKGRMDMRRMAIGMGLAGLAGLAIGVAGVRAADKPLDRAAIERIVHDYILAHPEILPEAMERLQAQAAGKAIGTESAALRTPFAGAWAGNPSGDVTLVMFSDYSCGYCKASAPVIAKLLREDPKLKVVWREIPVLGPQSEVAARTALGAAKLGHYPAFHQALFSGGRPDAQGLAAAAHAAGLDRGALEKAAAGEDVTRELQANLALAGRLGIGGTPAFVVGNRLLPGAVGHDALAAAIAEARRG